MGKKRREKLARRQSKAVTSAAPPAPKSRLTITIAAIAVIAILAVAAFAIVQNRQHATAADVAPTAAGPQASPGVFYRSQGHQGHFGESASYIDHFKYASDPPTSGAHREIFSPAFINDKPLPKYVQVHLLEHGNVLLQYNCFSCPDVVSELVKVAHKFDDRLIPIGETTPTADDIQLAEEKGQAVVVAPYGAMRSKIALTAWTRLETLDNADVPAIYTFVNAYLDSPDNTKQ